MHIKLYIGFYIIILTLSDICSITNVDMKLILYHRKGELSEQNLFYPN